MRPLSVHKLRPGDIDVIAAMGDSLTAGFGLTATNLFDVIIEERGKVFSIGKMISLLLFAVYFIYNLYYILIRNINKNNYLTHLGNMSAAAVYHFNVILIEYNSSATNIL